MDTAPTLFNSGFVPHGHCYLWNPWIVWLHVVSDLLIAAAYFSIPVTLVYFVRRRRDLEFSWMFVCFATFIIACGTTHVMEIWNVWHADYLASGLVKAVTAAASVPTAILLLTRVVPAAIQLPSPALLRQTNEALKRSNEDLEHFARLASHDLKAPLRKIAGYCDLLREENAGRLSPASEQYIQVAIDSTARMEQLIDSMLAYSRAGAADTKFREVDLNELLQHALDSLQTLLQETGTRVLHDTLPKVHGDAMQLMQVFQNLISNAVKFRRAERPRIEIGARREGSEWIVTVADNGTGIAPEHFNRIFMMFERVATERRIEGTGLGLAMCQRIIERHRGRIWVESELGQGSRFIFTLRVHAPHLLPAARR